MRSHILSSLLLTLATLSTGAPTSRAATVSQSQLFQLVVRIVSQPPDRDPYAIEGYRVASQDFITNAREIVLIPTSGVTSSDGEVITPDVFYVNSSSVTVRQAKSAAEVARPYAMEFAPLFAAPLAYVAQVLNYDYSDAGTRVYEYVQGEPYLGNDPPNNYNVPDPGEGHYLACDFNSEGYVGPLIYVANGLDPNSKRKREDQNGCAQIRLLPQCMGDFDGAEEPADVLMSSCYEDAETASLPTLPNEPYDNSS